MREIAVHRATSAEARESNAALLFFPVALFAVAAVGGDIAAIRKFYSEHKCKYLPEQLNILIDFGFSFSNFDGKKLPKEGNIDVYYEDNPDLLIVLSAISDKMNKKKQAENISGLNMNLFEPFICLAPGLFQNNSEVTPPKTLEHMAYTVGDENSAVLLKIADEFAKRGFTLKFESLFVKNRFFNVKGKDSLNHIEYGDYRCFYVDGNEKLILRLKLNNPGAYVEKIETLPERLKTPFKNAWCGNCAETCNRKIKYEFDGDNKVACGCFSFAFTSPVSEEIDVLMELFDIEQEKRNQLRKK